MIDLVRVYGLTVRSEIPLHVDRAAPRNAPVDLDVALGAPVARSASLPEGRLVLDLRAGRRYYAATSDRDGYRLRFFGACDVVLDRSLSRAVVHPVVGSDPDLLPVLATGALLAFVLAMRSEPVLHASAVQVGGAALAFVGASGMGKSTMATLLCADGARLVTDDVLHIDLTRSTPTCSLGATELRLRKGADHLAERFDGAPGVRTTGDDRRALAPTPATTEHLPLAALVVPVPRRSPGPDAPQIARVAPRDALVLLSRFPRLLGWQDPELLRTGFHQLADLVDRVPVHVAVLPWGPPFPTDTAAHVIRASGLATEPCSAVPVGL